MPSAADVAWLIPVLPLIGALITGLGLISFNRTINRLRKPVAVLLLTCVGAAAVLSYAVLAEQLAGAGPTEVPRMIGLFRQKYPDVAVQLQVHSTRRTGWSVANGQIDLAIIGGELPSELGEQLQVVPYASDELALVLPVKHALARLNELTKEDLYRLGFVCLDAQSTTRKMVDQLLARSGLDVSRLKIEMELNSFEAIKNAVQSGLGAAFLPVVSIERELAAGSVHRPQVADLQVRRQLKLITHPARYCSRAAEAFRREILPVFASADSPLRRPLQQEQLQQQAQQEG